MSEKENTKACEETETEETEQVQVDEWKDNFYRNYDDRVELGYIDEGYTWEEDLSYSRFVVKWEDMGHDNYKVYVMW